MSRTPRAHDPQRAPDRPFELREVVDAEGVAVDLLVEGERLFSGRVRQSDLDEMLRALRLSRDDVLAQLGRELVARFEQARARVSLSAPVLAPSSLGDGDRLVSRYVSDSPTGVEAGVAWYDVSSRVVGPDHVPLLVRSRMRDAVHRALTEPRPGALRYLLDALDEASS